MKRSKVDTKCIWKQMMHSHRQKLSSTKCKLCIPPSIKNRHIHPKFACSCSMGPMFGDFIDLDGDTSGEENDFGDKDISDRLPQRNVNIIAVKLVKGSAAYGNKYCSDRDES